jgi:predicted TIM-barrel fold metal-dependent hydrolase
MIVDCHTHLRAAGDDVDLSGHLQAAEKVDHCIVLAAKEDSSEQVNKRVSKYVNNNKGKMVGFAFIDPTKDRVSVKQVRAFTEKLHLQGVVLYCSGCGFHPAHSRAMQLYESAQELGLPVFFHNSRYLNSSDMMEHSQPILLDEIARTFPGLKIIIGNMGMPFLEQSLAMVAKHANVYADLTIKVDNLWQVYNAVMAAYEAGVMKKLLFGSGYPLGDASRCIETLLGLNRLLGDTALPAVPRNEIRGVIERDSLEILGITAG